MEIIKKSVLELLRVAVIAVIPLAINYFDTGEINWEVVVAVSTVAILKSLDKMLHEMGKEGNEALIKGLTRF